jgi:hypothetical protein
MRLREVRRRRIWENFAGIFLLITVMLSERSEARQTKFAAELQSVIILKISSNHPNQIAKHQAL